MASSGNPNQQQTQFDLQKLFKGTTNPPISSNLNSSPSFPSPSLSTPPPSSYPTPSSSYPPPTGAYPHYLPFPNLHHHQQQENPQKPIFQPPSSSSSPSSPHLPASPNPNTTNQDSSSAASPSVSVSANSANMASPQSTPTRMLSTKLPKGRRLKGENVVYDIDVKLPGEMQPQLEVTPITKYASDPGLVLGRQIAVNRSYICYGLKLGAIRVLNINTALRYLLRGHTQRVSDMAFFAEDVHLLASASTDGRIFIWKINEGPDEEDKPQITGRVILAIQILVESESVHPRVCWHPHKQEILIVAIGNRILKIDTMKAGKGETFSAEEPLKCNIDKLIDGVHLIGKHDDNITELSMCQWMKSRLASASADGTVKIWEERKATPLAVLRPHNGKPVNSVTFLTAPHRPDHIVLVTAGPLNQEVKIWVSGYEEGWLLPSDSESWICVQTLDIRSSSEANPEDAFFNQVVALPRAGLVLLANAKKNTIYAVHIEYGPSPTATRMDYISEFIVTMPILSLIGTSDSLPDGDHLVQIYCVQTQAIQQYGLNLSQCLPPPLDNVELEKTEPSVSRAWDGSTDLETVNTQQGHSSASENVVNLSSDIHGLPEASVSDTEIKPNDLPSHNGFEHVHAVPPPLPPSPRLSRRLSGSKSSSNILRTSSASAADHGNEPTNIDSSAEQRIESEKDNVADVPASSDNLQESDKVVHNDDSVVSDSPVIFKHPTHLVTPSEIFSKSAISSANSNTSQGTNVQDVAAHNDAEKFEVEVKVAGESETGSNQENTEYDRDRGSLPNVAEKKEKLFHSQASDLGIRIARDTYNIEGVRQADRDSYNIKGVRQADRDTNNIEGDLQADNNTVEAPDRDTYNINGVLQDTNKEAPANNKESEAVAATSQPPAPSTKGKRQRGKASQVSGTSSASPSPFNSADSANDQGGNTGGSSMESALPQLSSMQEMMGQLLSMQKELQKQMNVMVSAPVTKEGKRLEGSLGRSIEKVVKANADALWARIQEENAKQEKLERDHVQQITNMISNYINKDMSSLLEKIIKKEISSIGTTITRSLSQNIEKAITAAVTESFQKGVGDKALNQLEKSVSSKLEATVARQIQVQFQTTGKQVLQEALRTSVEATLVPAFEKSCKAMFEQIDGTFQNGLLNHTTAIQQQYDSTHSPLAITLRETINSASSITRTLSGQLADGQRKLLEMAANSKVAADPFVTQISNGLHEMTEDPTKELSRLINERKFEEAFTGALHRSDVSIVSWLCSQAGLTGILAMTPMPLSQGVLLSLLQQLSCDINTDTSRKLQWMTDVAAAIDPEDTRIAAHVRPILDQVYRTLGHHRSLPTNSPSEASTIRLLMHVINSVLLSCKSVQRMS
ncbi:enhancer of mRNA-decapping protein 4-like [Vicia villosa]|uniref:enhancer of mRNA-decapping protein 4-like n=1 Tax=Vicia villosa TaxID=3911 RepID=UPI00273CD151|nr:enhancer of mRNA-decapping protein 4-like [Vicia villosa]